MRRADENDSGVFASGGERGVLAEEAIAGMDGRGAVFAGGVQDAVDTQVALRGRRRADELGFIRHPNVDRIAVGGGVDRDGGDAHLAQGADDPDGDFAPVGDEDFAEHQGEF